MRVAITLALLAASGCGGGGEAEPSVAPTLSAIQAQIFMPKCTFSSCHGDAPPSGTMSLLPPAYDKLVNKPATQVPSKLRVKPGDPDGSYLYEKLAKTKPASGDRMPQGQPPLSSGELASIAEWIRMGAPQN